MSSKVVISSHLNKDVELKIKNIIEELDKMPISLREKIDREEDVFLDPFVEKLRELFDILSELPEEHAKQYEFVISEKCDELSRLVESMIQKQQEIRNDLQEMSSISKALINEQIF